MFNSGPGVPCSAHFLVLPYDMKSLDSRFWSKVQKTDGCWLWTATKNSKGYGYLGHKGAHRVSWELAYGKIPPGLEVCHSCDTRACVRPDHLFLGSHADNMRDCADKGRQPGRRRMSVETLDAVWAARGQGRSTREVARAFGLGHGTVWKIWAGRMRRAVRSRYLSPESRQPAPA